MSTAAAPAPDRALPPPARAFEVRRTTEPVPVGRREQLLAHPRSGETFTEHMARMTWTAGAGWHARRVEPYAPLTLSPAALVLHYGQKVFEGLKAYRHPDGSIWSFGPGANAARLATSARRMALPEPDVGDVLASIEALVATDAAWVPVRSGREPVPAAVPVRRRGAAGRACRAARRVVIASPAGSSFAAGSAPVAIWVEHELHCAGPGGTGGVKTMGNYGASLASQAVAEAHGCAQVCFRSGASPSGTSTRSWAPRRRVPSRPACGATSPTSSAAGRPTRTAGCGGWCECRARRRASSEAGRGHG
jgi:branched-chain amino acid aminotransferase